MSNKELLEKLEKLYELAIETEDVKAGLSVVEYMRIVSNVSRGG